MAACCCFWLSERAQEKCELCATPVPSQHPHLVQVVDKPGTDADQAIFHVKTADGAEHRMTLGRTGGEWGPT